ncbi:MAG: AbrB/MazE/SpoVT family DNA-binding domain-containing protein [Anaerolinea sp.]|nr:AbrB/MazE/SpoVT family DNA-binding domain-containing protein [Anaerolinea sp.]
MNKKRYVIQDSGQVTLPVDFRRKYNLKAGDEVVFEETDEGLLISTKELLLQRLLDDIGAGLRSKGITLEEIIESGREIKQEIYEEKYARKIDDESLS